MDEHCFKLAMAIVEQSDTSRQTPTQVIKALEKLMLFGHLFKDSENMRDTVIGLRESA